MAYSKFRFTENAAGMTGRASIAIYDGTGSTAQGGDDIGDIRGDNFFTGQEVKDACREAQKGPVVRATGMQPVIATTDGGGLKCLCFGNDGTSIETLYLDPADDQVKSIGGQFRVDWT